MPAAARIARRLTIVLVAASVLLVVALAAWSLARPDHARSWRQAVTIGTSLAAAQDGGDSRIARLLGHDTMRASVEHVQGLPATVVVPNDTRHFPPVVLFVPSGTTADEERDVADGQHALAAAGFSAWAVRVQAIDELLADDDAGARIARVIEHVSRAHGRQQLPVSVLAVGPVASLALHAAASDVDADIAAIVAVQPIADVRSLVQRALVDPRIDDELRVDAGRAIALGARSQVAGRAPIIAELLDRAADADDPITALRAIPPQVAPDSLRGIFDVLAAEDVAAFDAAWPTLPQALRDTVERHSPLPVAARIDARVLLVEDPSQSADARAGVARLAAAIDDSRTIRAPAHVDDAPIRELLGVSAWWLQRAGA